MFVSGTPKWRGRIKGESEKLENTRKGRRGDFVACRLGMCSGNYCRAELI